MSVAPDSDIHDAGNADGNMPVQMPLVCADARLVFNACQVLDDVLCSADRGSKGQRCSRFAGLRHSEPIAEGADGQRRDADHRAAETLRWPES
jgi:hypothetical protein